MKADAKKKKLQKQLQEALTELEQLDERLQQKADYGPGKGDPAIYDWELTLAMRQQAQARVETIHQALQKCTEGRYGICERCGERIDPERLEILPLTTVCIKCARMVRV
jgi:RNA polymerase-binding protein DksA